MSPVIRLPRRDEVRVDDTWDLASLFANDAAWEQGLARVQRRAAGFARHRERMARSVAALAACLKYDSDTQRMLDRVSAYAYLRAAEDQGDGARQRMLALARTAATRIAEASSFIQPELMAIPPRRMQRMLADPRLKRFRPSIERTLRFRPYTLDPPRERLLAMQGEMAATASLVFRQLHDADLKFGTVRDERGREVELTPATFSSLLQSPQRGVRRTAFAQFYDQFAGHQHALAAMLAGSVHKDVYYARARGYASCREAAVFADNVPIAVYDRLIEAVRRHLPAVHRYYDLRRRKMRLRRLHAYDTYVPILSEIPQRHRWDEAVETVVESLAPLGEEYTAALAGGLRGRWCDRYPNRGKQSGAFSYGSYDGWPYILMNYKPEVLDDLFTLAHEAGHSMHSYFSNRSQSYEDSHYTIFVAEVASTFNEQLLTEHLLHRAGDDRQRASLINNALDDLRGTLVRQTMFAEFEKIIHARCEAGEPLTVDALREIYHRLLEDYLGPEMAIDDVLSLECLRIPHFYRAFYVYKYATGLSAAIALAERVLRGGAAERDAYLGFLRGGCSRYPLDLLRGAGVDLETPQPVEAAMTHFARLVDALDQLL